MKILFTGNRGNLGKELIPLLEEEHSVQCYDIDYSNFDNVNSFFRHRQIDFIIHAAIRGGRRVRADIADDFYNNMIMFENLAAQNIPMINICSGASYGRQDDIFKVDERNFGERIPTDYYGLSKYLITHRCRQLNHVYNLRFFNVFGACAPKDMFTTANIINYINKREIVVFKDKFMDFFGIHDAFKVIDLYLKSGKDRHSLPKELNLVYPKVTLLSEVAGMINNLSDYDVPVDVLEPGTDRAYCGSGAELSRLGLELDGLQKSLEYVYENLRQRNV
jgi:nucleoside-diphosphate-sugar epimerase